MQLVLCLCLLLAVVRPTRANIFDTLILIQTNRAGYCSQNNCTQTSPSALPWIVRGLWPARSNGSKPIENCSSVAMDVDFGPIRSTLEATWPNLDPGMSNREFWENECAVHGSCIIKQLDDISSSTEYLQMTMIVFVAYNVQSWLDSAGVKPSNNVPISLNKLQDLLKIKFIDGVSEFYCEGQRNGSDVLQEVRLCLTADEQQPAKCVLQSGTCETNHVWYLPPQDSPYPELSKNYGTNWV